MSENVQTNFWNKSRNCLADELDCTKCFCQVYYLRDGILILYSILVAEM